jgi:hypothetical protein
MDQPVNMKTILGWLAIAFVVWWVIAQPTGAAHVVHNIGAFLKAAAQGLSNFFASTPSGKNGKPVPWWEWVLFFLGPALIVFGVTGMLVRGWFRNR